MPANKATRPEHGKPDVAALIFAKLRAGFGSCTNIAVATGHQAYALIPPDGGNIAHHLVGSALQYKQRMHDPNKWCTILPPSGGSIMYFLMFFKLIPLYDG
jgi:hypothetical protein